MDLWMQDIMKQKFLNSDITRIILLYGIIKNDCFNKPVNRIIILEYIYRTYADNPDISNVNPDTRIRHIHRYGLHDIKDILSNALKEWDLYAENHCLRFDEINIYVNVPNVEKEKLLLNTKMITQMIQKKYFKFNFHEPYELLIENCINDSDTEVFGKSLYKNRVLEDIQYCPLCEETSTDKLRVVHILPSICCNEEQLIDKNNALIMCVEHARDYINGKFYFLENGFVKNINSNIVEEWMHLSIDVKNKERRKYIRMNLDLSIKNKNKTKE